MKNEKFSKLILFLNQKTNYTFVYRKYNSFFDLKTKRILFCSKLFVQTTE